ncbi:MAG: cystathionine gamma-lyase, partial [Gemmatimonadaceae bacterium]
MHDATRVIRAGLPDAKSGDPFMPGPVFAAPYHVQGAPADSAFTYGRFHNPTWNNYEAALGALEGGTAVLFPSGMAASAAIFGTVLRPGQRVVMPEESYYTTRLIAQQYFGAMGVEVVTAKTVGNALQSQLKGATLLWLESPTNPGLDVCDIARLSELAHAEGVMVAVDNTTATALCQKPLALGADFSMASDTKAMTGHADLLMGHVATRDTVWSDKLRTWRTQMGSIPGPMETWLAHRSMGTLHVRLERQCASAIKIAEFFKSHSKITNVRYPGLVSDVSHEIAKKQMTWFGPVISFELADQPAVERFFATSTLVHEATSFGGIHTSAERRARWGADTVSEGFVRFSVGLEDVRDLIDDLSNALD